MSQDAIVNVNVEVDPGDREVIRLLAELLRRDGAEASILRHWASSGRDPTPDLLVAVGKIAVAMKTTAIGFREVQQEFLRRMGTPTAAMLAERANSIDKDVDEAWTAIQTLFERSQRQ